MRIPICLALLALGLSGCPYRNPADAGPDVPGAIDAPRGADTPTGTDAPTAMDAPSGTDTPSGMDAPSGSDTPVGTDAPVAIDAPTDAGRDAPMTDSGTDAGGTDAGMTDAPMTACVAPAVGQLLISEWMPNPSLVADAQGEWFEVVALAPVDINGLQAGAATLGMTPIVPLAGPCVHMNAGDRLIFARSSMSSMNGMLPAVAATFSFSLNNTAGTLQIGIGGTVLDTVTWATSVAARSIMKDTDGTQCNAPTGVALYNTMDTGTPSAINTPPECP